MPLVVTLFQRVECGQHQYLQRGPCLAVGIEDLVLLNHPCDQQINNNCTSLNLSQGPVTTKPHMGGLDRQERAAFVWIST